MNGYLSFLYILAVLAIGGDAFKKEWSVKVKGGIDTAQMIAKSNGLTCLGQIGNLNDYYRFVQLDDDNVETNADKLKRVFTNFEQVQAFQRQIKHKRVTKRFTVPNDPKWPDQWSLMNDGQTEGPPGLDLNVEKAWLQDITGNGVLVGVVDSGVDWQNDDIKDNYDPDTSFNFVDYTPDPSPDPDEPGAEHGTSCAGEIAMVTNDKCGVGVAYESSFAGLRLGLGLPGLTDAEEADALGHKYNDIMIYSNSWGPPDDGITFAGPGPLLSETFENGASTGRNNKGSVYVWSSGNGGEVDTCAADGYVNSIYTIAVGSADQNGTQAVFDEDCAAKMAVTYTLNSYHYNEDDISNQVITIGLDDQCIDTFTGTSSSAPLVSGTIALVLERNPNLSWRDIQYLIVYTSDTTKLNGQEWTVNGAGLHVNSQFGFGAIDAEAMVTRAKYWSNVPEQVHLKLINESTNGSASKDHDYVHVFHMSSSSIGYLEHVVVTVNIELVDIPPTEPFDDDCDIPADIRARRSNVDPCDLADLWPDRGDLSITLTSPSGTESVLLPNRDCDICQNGLDNWSFMSVHFWGEPPIGKWELTIKFNGDSGIMFINGTLTIQFYGTEEVPKSVEEIPDKCNAHCVRGCAAEGQQYCDSCKKYRDPKTLECLDFCNETVYNGYCLDYDPTKPANSDDFPDIATILISSIGGVCVLVVLLMIAVCVVVKVKSGVSNKTGLHQGRYTLV